MSPLHTVSILIIEDDESVRRTLADILELNGFSVLLANDGIEGLARARSALPALIITDINMPGMDGFELLAAFRADEALRAIPVIVVSAKVDRAATRHGMELGAADFITKPFSEEEVLRSIAARLEQKALLDELDAFAHTVAHDLKTPLATLTGRLELLGMLLDNADRDDLRHQLQEASRASARLNDIINELLILAGVRRQAVECVPLAMTALVTDALERIESVLKPHADRIELTDSWPVAVGYGPWVIEVWVNYLSNAVKYGGPEPRISLGGETSADGRFARFWVQDSGPGLDEAAKARMFIPFTRISTVRAGSHGLGLSIVRRIVEKLNGNVGVTSTPGAGARFWFELPVTVRPKPEAHYLVP